jgi:uncharacterized membrane protein YgcG
MPHRHPLPSRARRALLVAAAIVLLVLPLAPSLVAAGPPYPDPVTGQRVYDTASALSADEIARTQTRILAIEQRTGAQAVVYTQLVEPGRTSAQADADAQALMDQWGVGRKGIDDGLVILFDLYSNDPCHGQVQLYAGPGFAAAYLTNEERQAIYENDMLPLLRGCDSTGRWMRGSSPSMRRPRRTTRRSSRARASSTRCLGWSSPRRSCC